MQSTTPLILSLLVKTKSTVFVTKVSLNRDNNAHALILTYYSMKKPRKKQTIIVFETKVSKCRHHSTIVLLTSPSKETINKEV